MSFVAELWETAGSETLLLNGKGTNKVAESSGGNRRHAIFANDALATVPSKSLWNIFDYDNRKSIEKT